MCYLVEFLAGSTILHGFMRCFKHTQFLTITDVDVWGLSTGLPNPFGPLSRLERGQEANAGRNITAS